MRVLRTQDVVAWVTLGVQHVPKREDVPSVTTTGTTLRFMLMPFDFFEVPSGFSPGPLLWPTPSPHVYAHKRNVLVSYNLMVRRAIRV